MHIRHELLVVTSIGAYPPYLLLCWWLLWFFRLILHCGCLPVPHPRPVLAHKLGTPAPVDCRTINPRSRTIRPNHTRRG